MATRKKLNASELDTEIKEMFEIFDKNGDKTLSVTELGKAMRSLGFNMTQAEVKQAMVKIDTNKNGKIEFSEFRNFMMKELGKSSEVSDEEYQIRQAFKVFDKDGNGVIDKNELRLAMRTLGEKVSEADVTEMMRDADTNGDGKIDYEEFARMWTMGLKVQK
ncbi:hypothetical protein ACJMK2_003283 [Sinanodonta woodiana]|uniref:EF-hand domain-containing protein n=1 Tax=Sinanodonta woodiana TaxID=1069815 RepID=A0ABD3XXS9_SINWO